jgi:6-phosphogluconolactonase
LASTSTTGKAQANVTLTVVASPEEMAEIAAKRLAEVCDKAIAERGVATVALSGGNTPKKLYQILAASPYKEKLAWDKIIFLLGDERLVPITDKDSNYLMVQNSLLVGAPVDASRLLRVYTELGTPGAAAADYELTIKKHLGLKDGQLPALDFVLLGMGPDGHTASLFPHTDAVKNALKNGLDDTSHIVLANWVAKMDSWRITLTAPVLRNARNVLFQATGADKAESLKQVLSGPLNQELYPSQLLRDMPGEVEWLLDKAIAADLDIK